MSKSKYGVRIYKIENKLLVKQTILKGLPAEYVIDNDEDGNPREIHVKPTDDQAIASAVRDALEGKLKGKRA